MSILLSPPERLHADVRLPASKSLSARALVLDALSGAGGEGLSNLSDCDDTRAMRSAFAATGDTINIGAAGTAMRFLTAFLSVTAGSRTLTGTERMCHRPIGILVEALRSLGADIAYLGEEGFPPLRITGRTLNGGRIEVDGSISSQYVSALLMVGPTLRGGLTLSLRGHIASRPYIEMTMALMRQFGACVDWTDERAIAASGSYRPTRYSVEADWSAASYWYEAVALSQDDSAEVRLHGLQEKSLQGDSLVSTLFEPLGVRTEFCRDASGSSIRLTKNGKAAARMEQDFAMQPDLAQTFVACCTLLGTRFRFTGLESLRIKETDRLRALQNELRKLGFVLYEPTCGTLVWDGETCDVQPEALDTYEDHRMAMALAPVALRTGSLRINNPEVVSKSYPRFWNDLVAAGFRIAEQ